MQMPFGIRQQAERIRTYATMTAAEAQSSPASELVALMHRSADDLAAQFMFAALGPAPAPLDSSAHIPDLLQPPGKA